MQNDEIEAGNVGIQNKSQTLWNTAPALHIWKPSSAQDSLSFATP